MTESERDAAEKGRADAEAGRVEAEIERVDAEAGDGGPDLELGRVQAEEAREAAETERQDHELRRRSAEGGPDNHVEGEPPGTTGRVEAEEERQHAYRSLYRRVAVLVALPIALAVAVPAIGAFIAQGRTIDRLDREIALRCTDTSLNRGAIRQTVIDSLPTLGYRYNPDTGGVTPSKEPPIAYYRTHEDERQAALDRTIRVLDRFPPIEC